MSKKYPPGVLSRSTPKLAHSAVLGSTLCGYSTRVFPHNAAVNKSLVIFEQAEIITVKAAH